LSEFSVRPPQPADRSWIDRVMRIEWSAQTVAVHRVLYRPSRWPVFIAEGGKSKKGLLTHRLAGQTCEIVMLNSWQKCRRVSTAWIQAVQEIGHQKNCSRPWLIPMNDNTSALSFTRRVVFLLWRSTSTRPRQTGFKNPGSRSTAGQRASGRIVPKPFRRNMNNTVVDLIHKHASVRHYKPDPVPAAWIEAIVSAGQGASTSSNLQLYSVIAVTEEAKRDQLADLCGKQPHICEAPVFLAWCADLARLGRVCQLRGYTQVTEYVENFLVAASDTTIAAQNAALAAESLGLGICYIGSIRNHARAIIDLLALPKLVFPITGMTVGWPAKEPHHHPRLPLKAVLHWEEYNPDQDRTLFEYDQTMLATGIYKSRQVAVPGKADQMEDYSWQEHSARRVSRAERTDLRRVLEDQGFGLK